MKRFCFAGTTFSALILAGVLGYVLRVQAANTSTWKVGTPIVTYWAGPPLTDAVARQMAAGGFNLVWCTEKELDVAQRHGLRAQLRDPLLTPASLDHPERRRRLKALIERVRHHPALYSYFLTDEPSAGAFPAWGRLVAYLRKLDPAHLAYINLFPTYANNHQLGTHGTLVPAYRKYLQEYLQEVKPSLISYDHYQFQAHQDGDQYFLNLDMIRRSALAAGIPFLNIVQACSWSPGMRVPQPDEMRYLVYTTLAYGAQGISYFVYSLPKIRGGIVRPDGTPTPIYDALKVLNPEFAAIAKQLQSLHSLAVYHTAMKEPGCQPLPAHAAIRAKESGSKPSPRGLLLGYFGAKEEPTHVVVVNLDYRSKVTASLSGPARMERFDAAKGQWSSPQDAPVDLQLPPGSGKLLRVVP